MNYFKILLNEKCWYCLPQRVNNYFLFVHKINIINGKINTESNVDFVNHF
jgi:hypothetical protein